MSSRASKYFLTAKPTLNFGAREIGGCYVVDIVEFVVFVGEGAVGRGVFEGVG
jgi:hypothetical protein